MSGGSVVADLDRVGTVEAETLARAAWSLVAEPGDTTAAAVVAALGAPEALRWVVRAVGVPVTTAEADLRARLRAVRDDPRSDPAVGDGVPRDPVVGDGIGCDPGCATAPVLGAPGTALRVLARALPRWDPRLARLDPAQALDELRAVGGALLVPGGPGWPSALEDLGGSAPLCLWVRGGVPLVDLVQRSVAVVGARAATAYGQHVAATLATGLAADGVTVVSGGAFGIDLAAHRAALRAGGPTVALLAGGVDRPSPEANRPVLEALLEAGGALVSEPPPGTSPSRSRFLLRNRLIAALSGATVVVEAAWRSGALSTANHAAELLRPVGAVPGPVTSMVSAGCHRLVRDGLAVCVTGPDDVLELIGGADVTAPEEPGGGSGGGSTPGGAARRGPDVEVGGVRAPSEDVGGLRGPGGEAGGRRRSSGESGTGRGPGPIREARTGPGRGAGSSGRSGAGRRTSGAVVAARASLSGATSAGGAKHEAPEAPEVQGGTRVVHPPGSDAGRVVDALRGRRGSGVAELARRSGLAEREVSAVLGSLELDGSVRRTASGWLRG